MADDQDSKDTEVEIITPSKNEEANNPLAVNKTFAVNILKQIGSHNRIKADSESKSLRKFENEKRKKHTKKNLKHFSPQKTMYSDYVTTASIDKIVKKGITPFQQVQKLVTDAAAFDNAKAKEEEESKNKSTGNIVAAKNQQQQQRSNGRTKCLLDKTLLHNHLRHTNVHNRLKEEEEMWEQHQLQKTRKVTSLKSRSSREQISKGGSKGGSMYSDREGGNVKPSRVTSNDEQPRIGKYTLQLLKEKEKDPDKWSHTGFQQMFQDELKTVKKGKKTKPRVVVDESDGSSLTDSDDEQKQSAPKQSIKRRVVKLASQATRNVNENPTRKVKSARDIIMKTLQNDDNQESKSLNSSRKRKHVFTGGMRSDQSEEMIDTHRKVKSSKARWGHNGYEELSNGIEIMSDSSPQKKVKSLAIIRQTNGQSKVQVTLDKEETEEWTEKVDLVKSSPEEIIDKKERSIWKRLKHNEDSHRDTLKNSIHHDDSAKKSEKRLFHHNKKMKKLKRTSNDSDDDDDVQKKSKRKIVKLKRAVKRKRKDITSSSSSSSSGENESDSSASSFTESSDDERIRKLRAKKKRLMQLEKEALEKRKRKERHKATFSDYDSDFEQRR